MARVPLTIETNPAGEYPKKFNKRELKTIEAVKQDKNIELSFQSQPVWSYVITNSAGAQAVVPAEANALDELRLNIDGVEFEEHLSVVETTGTALYNFPYTSTSGLEIPLDADVTDGVTACEITNGILTTGPATYTVGSFPDNAPIMFECIIKIDDITDLDQLFMGFRKAEAYQAEPDNYDELAAIHVGETGATVADGQINIATILNGGATIYTDTTETDWADAGEHTLRVEVTNTGVCTFKYDGEEPTVSKTFSFDDGEVIIPFLFVENTSGSTTGDPGVSVSSWKCGTK